MIVSIELETCNGCGLCDEACPMDVIYMDEATGKPEIKFVADCMTCFNCELECALNLVYVGPQKDEPHGPWVMPVQTATEVSQNRQ
jgi:NAD-dependent dihydropyrimidine dehydrogenase PreA subunit